MTPAEIIVALGDTAAVARELGVSLQVVSNMKQRGITRSRMMQLLLLAQRLRVRTVTPDVLEAAAAPFADAAD
jgi:hypothetical protein